MVRHSRLSMAGNRHLNYALHMVALCQVNKKKAAFAAQALWRFS